MMSIGILQKSQISYSFPMESHTHCSAPGGGLSHPEAGLIYTLILFKSLWYKNQVKYNRRHHMLSKNDQIHQNIRNDTQTRKTSLYEVQKYVAKYQKRCSNNSKNLKHSKNNVVSSILQASQEEPFKQYQSINGSIGECLFHMRQFLGSTFPQHSFLYHSWPPATRNKFNIFLVMTITTRDIL